MKARLGQERQSRFETFTKKIRVKEVKMANETGGVLVLLGLTVFLFTQVSEARAPFTLINGWYKTACIAENLRGNKNYMCSRNGSMICLPGWTDEYKYCTTPICDPHCVNGNCTAPNVCTCDVGWYGADCTRCVPLPNCQNGNCSNPFECNCDNGWTGMFCDKPICKEGCVHGTCSIPGRCNCHPGWTGPNCDICIRSPDCVNGFCEKPMDCICEPGYLPPDCKRPICRDGCNATYGFCKNPGECWCRPGWQGVNCDQCQTYEGCQNGFCINPWDCICEAGFTGMLCDQRVVVTNSNINPNPNPGGAFINNPFAQGRSALNLGGRNKAGLSSPSSASPPPPQPPSSSPSPAEDAGSETEPNNLLAQSYDDIIRGNFERK